jgi:hypothetical protein
VSDAAGVKDPPTRGVAGIADVKNTLCSALVNVNTRSAEIATKWFLEVALVAITPQLPFEVARSTSPEMLQPALPGVEIWKLTSPSPDPPDVISVVCPTLTSKWFWILSGVCEILFTVIVIGSEN